MCRLVSPVVVALTLLAWIGGGAHAASPPAAASAIEGEARRWHTLTLTLAGPAASEEGVPNPFRDVRFEVTFKKGDRTIVVPGYFAADGRAGETGAFAGDRWRAHFVPDEEGTWTWTAALRTGPDVAMSDEPLVRVGRPGVIKPARGSFVVGPSDKTGRDFRARGRLRYVGRRYHELAGTGERFLKMGANSPENLLGFADFDGTRPTHRYEPHVRDFRDGDPTWRGGKGKGLIGAINYLAGEGVNAMYFLTMNVRGDGKDVWPWVASDAPLRFDVSKLDQWNIVFTHMDRVGIAKHFVLTEQENDQLLDRGVLGPERRLYQRELVARFGHHLGVFWNLGEENTSTHDQRKAFAAHLRRLDPWQSPIVVHSFPGQFDLLYDPLLGDPNFEGPSLQVKFPVNVHTETIKWIGRSARAGRPWVVHQDEIGPAEDGAVPDSVDPTHDVLRSDVLWAHFLAGGAGVEWYFGWKHPHGDRTLEDYRSRAELWRQTRIAVDFLRAHVPYGDMESSDGLTTSPDDYCLADPGRAYAIYLPRGGTTEVELGGVAAGFSVAWFDPRRGGGLQRGTVTTVEGPGRRAIGLPPGETGRDWVALVTRVRRDEVAENVGGQVLGFALVTADGRRPVLMDPLRTGVSLAANAVPVGPMDLEIEVVPPMRGSVKLEFDGKPLRTVNGPPYLVPRVAEGPTGMLAPGPHRLRVILHDAPDGGGKVRDKQEIEYAIVP